MALNVKVGLIGPLDMLKFKNMSKTREKVIQAAPAKEINGEFLINNAARSLHPDKQDMVIEEILPHEEAGAKTFVLKRTDGKPAAMFRAGQYVSVLLKIGTSVVTRPYSISSSPKWTAEGKVAITVKTNPGGFAANWILENWKAGDSVTISDGQGQFYYEDLRDSKNVMALAGGSGITPFLSMAYAIRDGLEDFNLTILFGSRTEKSILFKKELDEICKACPKVKVVHILSDEEKDGYEHGFITADLIRKYAPDNYSIFICGPEAMYRFIEKEVAKLNKPRREIRRELMGVTKKVWEQPGYPMDCKDKTFSIKVLQGANEYNIKVSANEPVLAAIERAGIAAPSRCRSGECGWCRSRLLGGNVFMPQENEGRRWADKEYGYIHPCASFPVSDLTIEVPGEYMDK